jgi:hypothetical protein
MTVQTSAGTTIALSATAPATYDEAGFAALTFTTIGEVIDLGSFGKVFNLVTYNPLGDRKTRKFKGSYNNGSISITLAQDDADAGQILAIAAADSDDNYSFEVTLQNGDIRYFVAKTMSYTTDVGTVDDITGATLQIELDDDVIFA